MAVIAKDFRIGNFVTLDEKQRRELFNNQIHAQELYFEVKTIYSDQDISLQLDDEIVDISENDITPIFLTEDILLCCGFKKGQLDFYEFEGLFSISFYREKGKKVKMNFWLNPTSAIEMKHIKYLHQLQNLYFSLTNKELKIEFSH